VKGLCGGAVGFPISCPQGPLARISIFCAASWLLSCGAAADVLEAARCHPEPPTRRPSRRLVVPDVRAAAVVVGGMAAGRRGPRPPAVAGPRNRAPSPSGNRISRRGVSVTGGVGGTILTACGYTGLRRMRRPTPPKNLGFYGGVSGGNRSWKTFSTDSEGSADLLRHRTSKQPPNLRSFF
jgi:hypothetical protein